MKTKTTISARSLHAENSMYVLITESVLYPRLVADGYGGGVVFYKVSLSVKRKNLMRKKCRS